MRQIRENGLRKFEKTAAKRKEVGQLCPPMPAGWPLVRRILILSFDELSGRRSTLSQHRMQILFSCPACSRIVRSDVVATTENVGCARCSWTRPVKPADFSEQQPQRCLICGCDDLWRQKDFPQKLGLALVGLGALLSTIAMAYYYPATALGVLLVFALGDLLLYTFMPDVLVCYRCAARHRHTDPGEDHPRFNLETAERYRQEASRLSESRSASRTG